MEELFGEYCKLLTDLDQFRIQQHLNEERELIPKGMTPGSYNFNYFNGYVNISKVLKNAKRK